VGGLELLSTAGSETERLLGTLEEALPDLDPMPGLNGAAQTLQGMGEHVGSELFGLGKTLGGLRSSEGHPNPNLSPNLGPNPD